VVVALRWWVGGQRGTAWRASSGGGGAWLVARREVQSTGGARGGVGGAVPWTEVPVCVEALLGGNGGAGWLAVGSEQRTTVRGGAWRQWEAHRLRGGPDGGWSRRSSTRWPWKTWRATAVAAWRLEPTRTRSNAVRERRSKSIWPPQ
jgi:hypothetical protein